ncbi:hypothetical protein TrST_g13689 [Triparma strigata]|uniref:Uncharacterized protein n=1 Tax=Triparma strigata TaxID=1606541 RepID=A0A9W7EXS2_9STRA|nr:hypothetical protein TrST_g13689 [Triparma strigata]
MPISSSPTLESERKRKKIRSDDGYLSPKLKTAADVTPAVGGDDFIHADKFRRFFIMYVDGNTLMKMRLLSKEWNAVTDEWIDGLVGSGEMMVVQRNDISFEEAYFRARIEQVMKVVFLLNITKVGNCACAYASNLVVVDIPEGITIICDNSFSDCRSLKDIKFPKSLTKIGRASFSDCFSLEEVDLLHTNVRALGDSAFHGCTSLREMKIPDSLQKFGELVFYGCSKLVPSDINVGYDQDVSEVVAYLRKIQEAKRVTKKREQFSTLVSQVSDLKSQQSEMSLMLKNILEAVQDLKQK